MSDQVLMRQLTEYTQGDYMIKVDDVIDKVLRNMLDQNPELLLIGSTDIPDTEEGEIYVTDVHKFLQELELMCMIERIIHKLRGE